MRIWLCLLVTLSAGAAGFAFADDGVTLTLAPVSVAVTVAPVAPVAPLSVVAPVVPLAPFPIAGEEKKIVPRRTTLTDLPPAIVSGEVEKMEILADSAPVGEVILRICKGYGADCAVVISGAGLKLAWTCSGDPQHCWRTFLAALSQLGVNVRVLPGVNGAAYAFSLSGVSDLAAEVAPENRAPAR